MITEHSAALQHEQTLFSQLGITPEDSPTNQMLVAQTMTDVQQLQSLSPGLSFDFTYMCMQIRNHNQLVQLLDAQTAGIQNAQLRAEAQMIRATALDHAMAAEAVVTAATAGTGTGGTGVSAACAPFGGSGPRT